MSTSQTETFRYAVDEFASLLPTDAFLVACEELTRVERRISAKRGLNRAVAVGILYSQGHVHETIETVMASALKIIPKNRQTHDVFVDTREFLINHNPFLERMKQIVKMYLAD